MYKKSGLIVSLMVFVIPPLMLDIIARYLHILPQSIYREVNAFPVTWLVVVIVPVLYLFLFRKGVSGILAWRKDSASVELDRVNKAVIMIPKLVLIGGLVYGMVLPLLLLSFFPKISMETRIDLSLLGFASTMFGGIPFYIPFIRMFEHWSNDIPFRKEFMSMKLAVRTNLVVLFLFSSILLILQIGIKYELKNAIFLEEVQTSLQPKLLPLELFGVLMGIFSVYLLMRGISQRIVMCHEYTEVLASGDFTGEKRPCPSRDELGALYESLNMVLLNNAELLRGLREPVSKTLSSKDAVLAVSNDTSSSIEQISLNIESVNSMMEELNRNVKLSMDSTVSLNENISHLGKGVEEQSGMVEESSGAIAEITASIDSISGVAQNKIESARSLVKVSDEGREKLDNTVEKINRINESVENIRAILSLIQNIAARTNLLAMNAAIEAAHAGDAGRGFAVVADEIRKLAETSSANSREINNNIGNIITVIQETSDAGGEAIRSFDEITMEINGMIRSFDEINAGLAELKIGSGQILNSITSLQSISRDVKSKTDEMNVATSQVNGSLDKLNDISRETSNAAIQMQSSSDKVRLVVDKMKDQSRVLDDASKTIESRLEKFRF